MYAKNENVTYLKEVFYLNIFFNVEYVRYTTRMIAMIQMYHFKSYHAAIAPSLIPANRVLKNWIISINN